MKRTAVLLLLALAACGSSTDRPPLPVARGPWVPMGLGHIGTGENALVQPPPGSALNLTGLR